MVFSYFSSMDALQPY